MIFKLPVELKLAVLELSPNLRYANTEFYILYNELFKMKTLHLVGDEPLIKISKLLQFFSSTFEFWNGALTKLYRPDLNWVLIYSLLKNRKIFFQKEDFVIQADQNNIEQELDTEYVHLQDVHAFHYHKIVLLPNGNYNFQVALRNLQSSRGLGTTRFQLNYLDESFTAYPPSVINDILPKSQLSVMNLGEFTINNPEDALTEVEIIIEEIGMYPKCDLIFDYLDFKPINCDYLYYTIPGDPFKEYNKFVNKIEKACHLAIDEIWNHPESPDVSPVDSLESFNEIVDQDDDELHSLKKYSKEFYTKCSRSVKMYYPSDQRHFREKKTGKLLDWRVPLLR